MQDNNDKIKKLAGSLLSQFEAEPPADMWSRIALQSRRKKRLILFRVLAMAASLLILMGVGFIWLMPGSKPNLEPQNLSHNQEPATTKPQKVSPKQTIPNFSGKPDPSIAQPVGTALNQGNKNIGDALFTKRGKERTFSSNSLSDPLIDKASSIAHGTDSTEPVVNPAEPSGIIAEVAETKVVIEPEDLNTAMQTLANMPEPDKLPPSLKEDHSTGWSLAMGYGTSAAVEISRDEMALNSPGSHYSHDEISAELANSTSYFEEVENTTHDAPLSFGFILSKQLGKRWYAESGLLYTRLGYRLKTIELNKTYKEYTNELYYLGIPLGIRFGILDRKRFGLFATQSVILEKGVTGSSYTESYKLGVLSGSESNRDDIRGVQLSSLTGLGGEIKIAGKISAYAQAGLQLFFLNGTQPYNIRSARMAWPSFQVGVRMKLD